MTVKPVGKGIAVAVLAVLLVYGWNKANDLGYLKSKKTIESSVPPSIDLPVGGASSVQARGVSKVSLDPSTSGDCTIKVLTIPWNATIGLHYANGGVGTTAGSLMAQRGLKVKIERQDDYAQMRTEQVNFAKEFNSGNACPQKGAAFVIIMGDGFASYASDIQEAAKREGFQVEVVGSFGYSRGEDKCMLPPEVKTNPQLARGSLIGAVLRDGDWHICVKWARDNEIAINPDEKTYDPQAMNFVAVNAFTEADEKLIAGANGNPYCETRPVVSKGKPTGEKKKVCQNGTATWTPGDVTLARNNVTVKAIASTREYRWQMPATVIGNKQWMAQNKSVVENFLAAAFEGGEKVRSDDSALTQGAAVEAQVYKAETPEYWKKYFNGDGELGGSISSGLGDNAYLFGLKGNANVYKSIYTIFGNIDSRYYPDVMPKVISYDQVVNTSYLSSLLEKSTNVVQAEKPSYQANVPTNVFASRSYNIEFEFNKDTFTSTAIRTLENLLNETQVSGLMVQINGHTDDRGSNSVNLDLSKRRADAVKRWLMVNSSSTFPDERMKTRGYGSTSPLCSEHTDTCWQKNRRVEVQLLKPAGSPNA
jgi:OOP family OmpA-OmpF porin